MKLLIAIPTLDYMHTDFVQSLLNLTRKIECQYDVCIMSGTLVYVARDKLADKAIEEGYTDVLWLDSDMVFTDTLLDDLQFCGKPWVTGVYQARRKGYSSCIFEKIDLKELKQCETYPRQAFPVEGCGFGCVLVSTAILADVKKAYKSCFLPMRQYGEDIAFCFRARELGHQLWCEPSAVCGHIGHITIYPEDHEDYMHKIGMR